MTLCPSMTHTAVRHTYTCGVNCPMHELMDGTTFGTCKVHSHVHAFQVSACACVYVYVPVQRDGTLYR